MTTWTKDDLDIYKIKNGDEFVIESTIFQIKDCWFMKKNSTSSELHEFFVKVFGKNWLQMIYSRFPDNLFVGRSDSITFSPTFTNQFNNGRLIQLLMDEYYIKYPMSVEVNSDAELTSKNKKIKTFIISNDMISDEIKLV